MRRFLLVFTLLLLIFITPMEVKAENKSYTIDKLNITAQITEKGDIEVQEEIAYIFHGNYNGVYRNLSKNGASGHIVSQVSIRDKSNIITPLLASNNSENNSYEIIDSKDNTQIKIFSKSIDEAKTFIFNYTILAAATKYADYGELNWNFYKVENNIAVNSVDLNLFLKNSKFAPDKFKYWSFVDGGEFNTNYDSDSIHLKGKNLTSLLGIKVQFQPEFLKSTEKSSDNNINQNMQVNPPISNNYTHTESDEKDSGTFIVIAIVALFIFIGIFAYTKNNQKFEQALEKYRSEFEFFKGQTLEKAPSDLSPALVNFLYHEKYISNSAIPSTLFYLCRKGYYNLERCKYTKSRLFGEDEIEDLCFVKNNRISSPASSHLKYFIQWFSLYEERGCFSLKSIEEEVNSRDGALKFRDCFSDWEYLIKEEAEELKFYTTIEGRGILSNKIYNERLKWLAYRKYLVRHLVSEGQTITISNIDEALIYASALEISEIHSEVFSRKMNTLSHMASDTYPYDVYNNNSFFLMNLSIWDNIDDNVRHNTVNDNNNNSNSSGSDGGFGGFSGGGDFSGGGGGDSGAF